jgi:preprotein translocase subunit SecA
MEIGAEQMRSIEKMIILQTMDMMWMNHLDEIDYLRDGIGLRGYGQRDPLIEYKREAFHMFSALLENIRSSIVNTIFKINIVTEAPNEAPAKNLQFKGATGEVEQFGAAKQADGGSKSEAKQSPIINEDKIGRNDPCPCGSDKKYKKCCGK